MTAADGGDLAAVVLAAGLGTRLRPLTDLRPKPLCPVGSTTLLDAALARVAPHVSGTAVNAHHLADQIVAHVGDRAYVSVEPQLLGTAGALGRLRGWLAGRAVLVHNGDAFLDADLADLVAGWDGRTVRLLVRDEGRPADFGTRRYVGAALLPAADVARLPDQPAGLHGLLWRPAEQAGRLDLVPLRGVAIDCGTPTDYLRANLHVSGGRSVIGAGARVAGRLVRSVVWPGGRVGAEETLVEAIRTDTGLTVHATLGQAAAG